MTHFYCPSVSLSDNPIHARALAGIIASPTENHSLEFVIVARWPFMPLNIFDSAAAFASDHVIPASATYS